MARANKTTEPRPTHKPGFCLLQDKEPKWLIRRKWCTISAECGCPNARTTSYDHLSQEQVDLVCEFVTLEDRPIEHEIWDRIGGFYREVAAAIGRARQGAEEAARAPEAGEGAAAASWAPAAPSTAAASPRQQPKKKAAAPKLGIDVCPPGICIFLRGEAGFGAPTPREATVGGLGCSRWRIKGRVPFTLQASDDSDVEVEVEVEADEPADEHRQRQQEEPRQETEPPAPEGAAVGAPGENAEGAEEEAQEIDIEVEAHPSGEESASQAAAPGAPEALPALQLWQTILDYPIELVIHEDNQATILVAKKGYSPKLRHIACTHKVNLGSIAEVLDEDDVKLHYVETNSQAADIFTKALAPQKWDNALRLLGMRQKLPEVLVDVRQLKTKAGSGPTTEKDRASS
ncbi:unnamed protein product [Symbiodinium microadriaticum]|nr:unnamed protein product [Symbiodinium microadriaticum]